MKRAGLLLLILGLSANVCFAQDNPLDFMNPCYAQLKPEIVMSPETLKVIHERTLAGQSADYKVVLNSTVDENGLSTASQVTTKSGIDELDGMAQDISKVAAIRCKGISDRQFRETYRFDLNYEPGPKPGTVVPVPYFLRESEPVSLIDAPLAKRLAAGVCAVDKYNEETGVAEGVECGFDGYCTVVGTLARPSFPRRQSDQRRVGKVTVKMSVSPAGVVEDTEALLSSGNAAFDRAAMNAAARTRFKCTGSKPLNAYSVVYQFSF